MDVANQMSTWGEWWTDKGTEITDDDIHIKKRGDRQCSPRHVTDSEGNPLHETNGSRPCQCADGGQAARSRDADLSMTEVHIQSTST